MAKMEFVAGAEGKDAKEQRVSFVVKIAPRGEQVNSPSVDETQTL